MKKLLLLIILYSIVELDAQQCPVCVIDLTCDSVPAAPKLCPRDLPEDTAGQYYEADMSFYMPKQFQHPDFGTVNLNKIDVLGITGLPPGMSWTAYDYTGAATTTFYPPASPPASERGCAKVCGTPPMPFEDSVSVTVVGYVTISGVNGTQNVTFKVFLKIIPNPSGNSVFSMSNSQGCDSLSVNFTPNLQSNGNPLIKYNWNFGNGQTSTSEFPTEVYPVPGDYPVICTTTVYHYVVTAVTANAIGSDWCGDVEEWACWATNPDLFFQINSNGGITSSDTVPNTATPSWSNLSYPIEGNQFILYFFDKDNGPPLGSNTDSLGNTTVNLSGSGGTYDVFTLSQYVSGDTSVTGSITVELQVKETFIDSDFIHVYGPPMLNPVAVTVNDSICDGDSVLLSINSGYSSYQWYEDTVLLIGEMDSFFLAREAGDYWVRVTNGYGCSSNSNSQHVTIMPNPPMANFIFMGNNTLKTFLSGFALQWYLNGSPVSGATSQTFTMTESGYYRISTTNGFCTTFSDSAYYTYTPVGMEELAENEPLKVFPNPNKGQFTITYETAMLCDLEIMVTDILGKVVYAETQKEAEGIFTKEIQLVPAESGVYFLRFTVNGITLNKKIMVE